MSYTLKKQTGGSFFINGSQYPKGSHIVDYFTESESIDIRPLMGGGQSVTGKYSDFNNGDSNTPFASFADLKNYITDNFFNNNISTGGSDVSLLDENGKIKPEYLPDVNIVPLFDADQFGVVDGKITYLQGNGALPKPAAPSNGVVDDTANTFGFTNNGGLTTLDTEKTTDGGATYGVNTDNPFSVGDAALAIGQVGVRYKGTVSRQASDTLFNTVAFTPASGGNVDAGFTPITTHYDILGIVQTGSRLDWASTSDENNYGYFVSTVKVPAGGAFEVRWTSTNDVPGMWAGMADNNQRDTYTGMEFPVVMYISNNYGKILTITPGGGNYPDTGNMSWPINARVRVRGTGTRVYVEYSKDGGTTWTEIDPSTVLNQPQVPLYFKAFGQANNGNFAIKDMMQIGMA